MGRHKSIEYLSDIVGFCQVLRYLMLHFGTQVDAEALKIMVSSLKQRLVDMQKDAFGLPPAHWRQAKLQRPIDYPSP